MNYNKITFAVSEVSEGGHDVRAFGHGSFSPRVRIGTPEGHGAGCDALPFPR